MSPFNSLIPTLGRHAAKSGNGNLEAIDPSVKPVYDIRLSGVSVVAMV